VHTNSFIYFDVTFQKNEMKKIIAAGGLVLNDNNELLMIFRRQKWDLPKGKIDEGESIEACALREVKEETGLKKLSSGKFIDITVHTYTDPYLNEDVIKETHWFKMYAPNHQLLIPQSDEGIEKIEWVNDENLQEKLQNSYANIIEIISKLKQ
jgi:8-oxo-dGTP pyrophosphatase MutT (NUDIX family)